MASSSVSQDDVENDFELNSRRSRIRSARARTVNPATTCRAEVFAELDDIGIGVGMERSCEAASSFTIGTTVNMPPTEHDASPKPLGRLKDKRAIRPNHMNKGKTQQRDRRKLREKRRSTGVVHLPSTESTGGSTGEDEDETLAMTAETRRNTQHNECLDRDTAVVDSTDKPAKSFASRRNKSPSDLEADDEDNQEFDSLNQSDSATSYQKVQVESNRTRVSNGRPGTPTGENLDELLERAREENRRLLSLLEEKDRKISTLETIISQLRDTEQEKLEEEKSALLRAVNALTTK